jgi:hypothetical protein
MSDEDDIIGQDFYDKNLDNPQPEKKEPDPADLKDEGKIKEEQDKFFSKDILEGLSKEDISDAEVDVAKLSKTNYLYTIFGTENDNYKSIYYLRRVHQKYLKEGYPEGTILNNYLFVAVVLRRLQVQYQEHHKSAVAQDVPRPEDFTLLEKIEKLSDKLSKLQKSLDDQRNAMRSGADIHDLHQREIDDNAKFVQEHVGEFSFRCKKCDTIVQSGGLPHWAFEIERGDKGEPLYHIWSTELFYAVKKGHIPLHMMAFALQTSIEGLQHTAKERGEIMPVYDILEEEKNLKEVMVKFERA